MLHPSRAAGLSSSISNATLDSACSIPGAQILSQRAVQPGPEHDRPLIQRIVDRQDRGPEPARVPDPANASGRDQPEALHLIQQLNDRCRVLQRLVVTCHAAHLPDGRYLALTAARPVASLACACYNWAPTIAARSASRQV